MGKLHLDVVLELPDGHIWLDDRDRPTTLAEFEELIKTHVPGLESVAAQVIYLRRVKGKHGATLQLDATQFKAETKRRALRGDAEEDVLDDPGADERRGKTMLHHALPNHPPAQVRQAQLLVADLALLMEPDDGQTREDMLAELLRVLGLYRKTGLEKVTT